MPRVTITVADRTPQPYRFPLETDRVTIGRGSENDIAVDCGSVSLKHAEMVRVPGGFELRDMGSTNGLKEAGVRKTSVILEDGSSAKIGDVTFDITFSAEETAVLAGESAAEPAPIGLPEINKVPLRQSAAPTERIVPTPRRAAPVAARSSSENHWGFGALLIFLLLALAAFCTGMAIRFQKDTGGKWFEAIQKKIDSSPAPQTK